MNFLQKIISLLVILICFYSCEENFSPIGTFEKSFAFNCVLRGDSFFQEATLSTTYFADGRDPFTNSDDPTIKNAIIKIWLNPDTVVIMNDSSIARTDTSRYNSPEYFYYIKNFRPGFGQQLRVEALLPTGERLVGVTSTPKPVEFSRYADNLMPMEGKNTIDLSWIAQEGDLYYFPRLTFRYYREKNGQREEFTKEIPTSYVPYDGKMIPNYPRASASPSMIIQRDALNRVMAEISEGDNDKNSYFVYVPTDLEVLILDKNLKSYYQASVDGLDQFTVRLDGSDFTNIKGGIGIFGSYLKISKKVPLSEVYLNTYGYNAIY